MGIVALHLCQHGFRLVAPLQAKQRQHPPHQQAERHGLVALSLGHRQRILVAPFAQQLIEHQLLQTQAVLVVEGEQLLGKLARTRTRTALHAYHQRQAGTQQHGVIGFVPQERALALAAHASKPALEAPRQGLEQARRHPRQAAETAGQGQGQGLHHPRRIEPFGVGAQRTQPVAGMQPGVTLEPQRAVVIHLYLEMLLPGSEQRVLAGGAVIFELTRGRAADVEPGGRGQLRQQGLQRGERFRQVFLGVEQLVGQGGPGVFRQVGQELQLLGFEVALARQAPKPEARPLGSFLLMTFMQQQHGLDVGKGRGVGQRLLGPHEGGSGTVQVVAVEVHQAQSLQRHTAQEQRAAVEHLIEQFGTLAGEAALLIEVDQQFEGGLGLGRQTRPVGTLEQRLENLLGAPALPRFGGDQPGLEQRLSRCPPAFQRRLEGRPFQSRSESIHIR